MVQGLGIKGLGFDSCSILRFMSASFVTVLGEPLLVRLKCSVDRTTTLKALSLYARRIPSL